MRLCGFLTPEDLETDLRLSGASVRGERWAWFPGLECGSSPRYKLSRCTLYPSPAPPLKNVSVGAAPEQTTRVLSPPVPVVRRDYEGEHSESESGPTSASPRSWSAGPRRIGRPPRRRSCTTGTSSTSAACPSTPSAPDGIRLEGRAANLCVLMLRARLRCGPRISDRSLLD